mgnify:CR=1 FL=1
MKRLLLGLCVLVGLAGLVNAALVTTDSKTVLVNTNAMPPAMFGPKTSPIRIVDSAGVLEEMWLDTVVVPWNDVEMLERDRGRLEPAGRDHAGNGAGHAWPARPSSAASASAPRPASPGPPGFVPRASAVVWRARATPAEPAPWPRRSAHPAR